MELTLSSNKINHYLFIHKEGICYAKSHLLAALLRYHGIPAGFCYQKLLLCDETAPYIIIHGLNAAFVSRINKWIRLDPRGNDKPDKHVVEKLKKHEKVEKLFKDLPKTLEFEGVV